MSDIKDPRADLENDDTSPEGSSVVYVDRLLWRDLAEATDATAFCRSWLAIQASLIPGAHRGVVVFGEPEVGPFRPVATWPEGRPPGDRLVAAAEQAMASRNGQVDSDTVAYPMIIDDRLYGVVALEVAPGHRDTEIVLRNLQWGAAWLELFLDRRGAHDERSLNEELIAILDLLADVNASPSFRAASYAWVNAITVALAVERVSLGIVQDRRVKVIAMSHSAGIDTDMELVQSIEAAMEEAMDQVAVLGWPDVHTRNAVVRAHEQLADLHGKHAVVSVPLAGDSDIDAVVTVESGDTVALDASTVARLRRAWALIGPVLTEKKRGERGWFEVLRGSVRDYFRQLLGPEGVMVKVVTAGVLLAALLLLVLDGDHRVTADAYVEGAVLRSLTTPVDGYITEAHFRAGEVVPAGALMVTLDDSELRLKRLEAQSELAQYEHKAQEAAARRERAEARVQQARVKQAAAQLRLLDEQISRMRLHAPFDGIVISGDLSQKLGVAVKQGEPLFEIAPLHTYRVVLKVDEHDIAWLSENQQGELVLSALPDQSFPLRVERITPVSTAEDGLNYFTVHAALDGNTGRLRPGMVGVGKVDVGERRLFWIYTHKLRDWLSLKLWEWIP